jgi:predicted dienelactone hydrolase
VQDVQFMLDELTRWNASDSLFAGRLDLDRMGIFGHSYGGSVAAETCRQEPRCKAGASLDGGSRQPPFLPFEKPFLMFDGNYSGRTPISRTRFRTLYDALKSDAYWLGVKSEGHFEFVDEPWFLHPTSATLTRTPILLRRYLLAFFNKYLKGEDDHLLDGPSLDYPEVNPIEKK